MGLLAFVCMLYLAGTVIVPLIYSTLIAVVLNPVVNFLVRKKVPRVLAIFITLITMIVLSITIVLLLSAQIVQLSQSFPLVSVKLDKLSAQTISWLSAHLNISKSKINEWMSVKTATLMNDMGNIIGRTILNSASLLIALVLTPVYIFMILFYKTLLLDFVYNLFSRNNQQVYDVLLASRKLIQSYLVGLVLEAIIIAILNCTCLLLIGIDYAILLGIIGAMLNVIPYLGGIISVALPMLIAFATKTPLHAVMVLGSYIFIQFADNHFVVPAIVASKLRINALITVIVVIVGGALWGVAGMFLSIPLTAVLKVVFDHIESAKPWGALLGNMVAVVPRRLFKPRKK